MIRINPMYGALNVICAFPDLFKFGVQAKQSEWSESGGGGGEILTRLRSSSRNLSSISRRTARFSSSQ
jgi:hypothetical protein